MAGVFPDNEQYASSLEQAAVRLRQTDQIGGAAQVRAEQLRAEVESLADQLAGAAAELAATRIVLADLREQLAQAQQWWFAPLRAELERPAYSAAVTARGSAECYRLLTLPALTPAKEIPAARINAQLATMRSRLGTLTPEARAYWVDVLSSVSLFTTITIDDPLTVQLLDAAETANLLTAQERAALGMLPKTPLERLGLTTVVTAPAHIAQAMNW